MGRDAMKVVLYEDNAKRRVGAMIAGLRGLQTLNTAVKGFAALLPGIWSSLLRELLTPGQGFPELDGPLGDLEGATDWQEAAASGRAIPSQVTKECCSLIAVDLLSGAVANKQSLLAQQHEMCAVQALLYACLGCILCAAKACSCVEELGLK